MNPFLPVAVLAVAADASLQSPRADGDFTSRFATSGMCFELDLVACTYPDTLEQPGAQATSAGLALDATPGAGTRCVLRPWHLDGTKELYVAWNATVPRDSGLTIEARFLSDAWPIPSPDDEPAWVVVGRVGWVPPDAAAGARAPGMPTRMEAREGYVRCDDAMADVQLRLRAFGKDARSEAVLVKSVCFAGSDRSRLSSHSSSTLGSCSLGNELIQDAIRRAHEESHQPHAVPCAVVQEPLVGEIETATAAACLRMLLARASSDPGLEERLEELAGVDSRSLPSRLAAVAFASGARSKLECCSVRGDAEMLLIGGAPAALRTLDERGRRTWVLLAWFDEREQAVVYDPASDQAAPQRWSWELLEKRWFGAGGLALCVEH